jgi:hypothetical protein
LLPRPTRERFLPLLLVGALLLCHGVFGALHLVCDPLELCAGGAEHTEEHQPAAEAAGGTHEHPTGHATGTAYFAVVIIVGLLGLLLRLLSKGDRLRTGLGRRWPPMLRRASVVFRPPRAPTSPVLQVFRL